MEFQIFMDFLMSLSLFGENAPAERMQELIMIMERDAFTWFTLFAQLWRHLKVYSILYLFTPLIVYQV